MSANTLHDGHRSRLNEKSRLMGFENLEEHEQLEKILFTIIPRGNTNGIAHTLLNEFGSLYGVLTTDIEQLKAVDGVGAKTAEFLHCLLPLLGVAERSMISGSEKPILDTSEKMCAYVKTLFYGKVIENLYMISLNTSMRVIRFDKITEGSAKSASVSLYKIARRAILNGAYAVILAHNHPGGKCEPSVADLTMTRNVSDALSKLDIILAEHIITASSTCHCIKNGKTY